MGWVKCIASSQAEQQRVPADCRLLQCMEKLQPCLCDNRGGLHSLPNASWLLGPVPGLCAGCTGWVCRTC